MNIQAKLLRGVDGNYLIMVVSGLVHINGVQRVLNRVIEASRQLLDCKVLLDFQDCTFRVQSSEFTTLGKEFDFSEWPHNNKIVLVSTTSIEHCQQLALLRDALASNRIRVAAFPDTKEAINWLSNA